MANDLFNSMHIAGAGMRVQGERMKVVSQNIANADSAGEFQGDQPYRRKTISFKETLDKEVGVERVKVSKIGEDKTPFKLVYNPGHPAADSEGYVQMPNVDVMMELMDMREAQRSYEANLSIIDVSKNMLFGTINMLK